jgi:hypothetical protein
MAFSDLQKAADQAILKTFGESELTIHFSDNSPAVTVPVIVKNPALEEDYIPGSQQGVSNLFLFVRSEQATSTRMVKIGDTATFGGVDYDIHLAKADREGGLALRLKRRGQRWDQ